MQPSNEMQTKLKDAAQLIKDAPSRETELRGALRVAFTLGKVYGRGQMAKEVLEDLARGE